MFLKKYDILIFALLALETVILFYTKHNLSQTTNAVLYFLISVFIGLTVLIKFYKKNIEIRPVNNLNIRHRFLIYSLALIPLFLLIPLQNNQLLGLPIDIRASDIIPSIQIFVKRFLSNAYVYTESTDLGYHLYPTYLPLHWLPFTIAELMHFDYRWIALSIWLIAFLILFIRLSKTDNHIYKILIPALVYLLYLTIYYKEEMILAHTIEMMVAGYYMFLIIGLTQPRAWITGLTIAVCLLSRFSLVLWLPLYAFILLVSGNQKKVLIASLTCILIVTLVYILPFLSKDWSSFYHGLQHYNGAAIWEWGRQNEKGLPSHLYAGTGFAHLFYQSHQDWNIADRVRTLQKVHVFFSFGITVLMGIWYWFNKHKIDYRIFLMVSFKIYLSVFLVFIQVPYTYLMIVGNFVSIAIFSEQMRYTITSENKNALR